MISNSVITAMMITVILSVLGLLVPFIMIFVKTKKTEEGMIASLGLGLLAYFWSQYLLPVPIIYLLTMFDGFMTIFNDNRFYVLYILITAVLLSSLGILSRLWCVWLMNRRTPSLYRALCSGIGYAVFGAASVLGSYITYINYSKFINANGVDTFTEMVKSSKQNISAEAVDNMVNQLLGANVTDITFEGINVLMVIIIELGFITFIYEGFVKGAKWKTTLIGGAINIAFAFVSMLLSALPKEEMGYVLGQTAGAVVYNLFMLLCGLFAAWYVYGALQRYNNKRTAGAL